MTIVKFSQLVELEHGDAQQLYLAVATVWRTAYEALIQEPPHPIDISLLLALPVLQRLGKRLYKVCEADTNQVGKPRYKPRLFRFSCEEVAVVMRYVWPTGTTFTAGVLGKVQQKSLNLAPYVNF